MTLTPEQDDYGSPARSCSSAENTAQLQPCPQPAMALPTRISSRKSTLITLFTQLQETQTFCWVGEGGGHQTGSLQGTFPSGKALPQTTEPLGQEVRVGDGRGSSGQLSEVKKAGRTPRPEKTLESSAGSCHMDSPSQRQEPSVPHTLLHPRGCCSIALCLCDVADPLLWSV